MISIIIAFHKGRNYLKDCLDSIRNQKYKDIETIIVKDMKALDSSENIDELISEYLDDINVKVFELKNKTGVSAARNLGIENAKGEYVYFLDSDDYVMEDTFTNLLEAVDTPPDGLKLSKNEIKFVYGRIFHTWFMRVAFNIEQGNVDEDEKLIEENPEKFADAVDYKFAKCNRIEEVTCLGTLYNRDFLNKSKIRFDEEQKLYGDVTFLVNVFAKDGQYSYCKDSIYVKRYHNDEINLPSIDKLENENRDDLMAKAYIDAFRICREKKVTFEIKDALAKIFAKFYIDDFSRRMQSQGLSMDQYFQFTGMTADKMMEDMKPQALKRIQTRLVLEKVAEVENIQPTEEEVNEEISKMAEAYKMEADKLKELLGERELEQMKKDMAVQKAVTVIADAAKEV